MNKQDWSALLPSVDEEYIEQAVLWCQDIVGCLIKYANKTHEEAEQLVVSSYIVEFLNDDAGDVFREIPYYWAMELLYGYNDQQWYKDTSLWPPPSDYRVPYLGG